MAIFPDFQKRTAHQDGIGQEEAPGGIGTQGVRVDLAILDPVTEVYSLSGKFDLLVVVKCETVDMIEYVITDGLLKTEGILDSETMLAFRSLDKKEAGTAVDVD